MEYLGAGFRLGNRLVIVPNDFSKITKDRHLQTNVPPAVPCYAIFACGRIFVCNPAYKTS